MVWNSNDDNGWEKFRELTENHSFLLEIWESNINVQICFQNWQSRPNRILVMCFTKKRINERKQLYNSEIGKNYEKELIKPNANIDRKIDRQLRCREGEQR